MSTLIGIIVLLAAGWGLAHLRASPKTWASTLGVLLILFSFFHVIEIVLLVVCWVVFLSATLLFNVPAIRIPLLTKGVMQKFRKILPPITQTERIALEAGDVWWEAELFRGRPDWNKLLNMPKSQLTAEEQAFLDNQVETLCSMLNDWEMFRYGDMPEPVWDYLKAEGFFGLVIDKKYGGRAFSAAAHSAIVTKIATRSISTAVSVMVPNSLGPGELLHHYGTSAQKDYYLPRLAAGDEIPCFALTAPEAGSDATNMPDKGIICKRSYNGKETLGVLLNFDKRYITLAPIATVIGVAFKLFDPEHLLGTKENIGITLALIPSEHPGIESGKRHMPLGMPFMNGPVSGKDVFIPLDFIIGGTQMCGQGWRMLMECLSIGRGISLPALSTGVGQLCYRMTGAYSMVRKQFGMSLGKFEGIEEALARIGGMAYLCEATRVLTISALEQKVKPSLASAITKYHLTEFARQIINDAMDIHGGRGIQLGPVNYIGLAYMAIPVSITVEGANILTRNLIIFGQGATRCHPYVKEEIEAVNSPDEQDALVRFDRLLCGHIGYAVSNFFKTFGYGLTGGKLIRAPVTGALAAYYRKLTRMSAALAFMADIAMSILGGELKRRENLSARLGDMLSQLYLASAVLKYYEDNNKPESDMIFVNWALERCLYQIQLAVDDFTANFSNPWLGGVMRFIVFPWGRAYKPPKDNMNHKIASAMMKSGELRDRLTHLCYVGEGADDSTGCMELAFQLMEAAGPVLKKLHLAAKSGQISHKASFAEQIAAAKHAAILSENEVELLQKFESLRLKAIQVDEFNPNTLGRKPNNVRKHEQIPA